MTPTNGEGNKWQSIIGGKCKRILGDILQFSLTLYTFINIRFYNVPAKCTLSSGGVGGLYFWKVVRKNN